ncbi:hypothetical protein MPSEU_000759900 [Mayamaea pseudoterrestris]|nr:hypothetical protein MPSEU_000759900 [Mayamaea pseudoterrestris]
MIINDQTNGNLNATRTLTAAHKAQMIVPELAKHAWHDEFFDLETDYEVIAVFGHSAELFAGAKRLKLMQLFKRSVVLLAVSLVMELLYEGLANVTGILLGVCFTMATTICQRNLPHTAVTTAGVVHVDEKGIKYFVFFSDIINVSLGHYGFIDLVLPRRLESREDNVDMMVNDQTNSNQNATETLTAAQAQLIVPELAKHAWHDEFFDLETDYEVIAMFDHSAELFAGAKRLELMQLFKRSVVLLAVSLVMELLYEGLANVTGILLGVCFAMATMICQRNLPHTAVTTAGVVHVDEKVKHFIPFSDITNVSLGHYGFIDLVLPRRLSFYRVPRPFCLRYIGEAAPTNVTAISSMSSPMKPLMFQRIVSVLKEHHHKCSAGDEESYHTSMSHSSSQNMTPLCRRH